MKRRASEVKAEQAASARALAARRNAGRLQAAGPGTGIDPRNAAGGCRALAAGRCSLSEAA